MINPSSLHGVSKRLFERIEFDENEQLVSEIRKHPFGLFLRYVSGVFVVIVFSIVFFVIPQIIDAGRGLGVDNGTIQGLMALVGLVLVTLAVIVTAISAYLYQSNVMLVTSEKLAQVLNPSLFNTKISQLSIGDVQDVTVTQVGFIPKMLNYGTIVIETAGEQQNYAFTFTPDPYQQSKAIVGAHERNLHEYGN